MTDLHRFDLDMADIIAGDARIVHCPECGQLEIWSVDEELDHGLCRTRHAADRHCSVCTGDPLEYADTGLVGERAATPYLGVAAAAAALDLEPSYVRRLCRSGRLAAEKRGRDWWVRPSAVAGYVRTGKGRPRKATTD